MIKLNVEQGSDEWYQARLGIPTSSAFDKIITPTGKLSASSVDYRNILLAEYLDGPRESYSTDAMLRGQELEPEARRLYEFTTGNQVEQVGLVYKDKEKLVSCSPDGLVGDGGIEIKCPLVHTHIGYLLGNELPKKYKQQVQGSLWVTGQKWWDFMSYFPGKPPLIVRVERDEPYIELIDKCMNTFISELVLCREALDKITENKKVA